jgi:hypothetical protein
MQGNVHVPNDNTNKLPDEDGTIMVYGFVQIKDLDTGEIIVNVRS